MEKRGRGKGYSSSPEKKGPNQFGENSLKELKRLILLENGDVFREKQLT